MTSHSEFCAVCLSTSGPFVTEPIGANDADVLVCRACRTVHPRSGRYAFEGGEDPDGDVTGLRLLGGNFRRNDPKHNS